MKERRRGEKMSWGRMEEGEGEEVDERRDECSERSMGMKERVNGERNRCGMNKYLWQYLYESLV